MKFRSQPPCKGPSPSKQIGPITSIAQNRGAADFGNQPKAQEQTLLNAKI